MRPQKLGNRLSLYFISISVFFIVLTATFLIVTQYQQDKESVYGEAADAITAVESQLARSIWNVDQDSIELILQGVQRLPSVAGIRVRESLGSTYVKGNISASPSFSTDLAFKDERVGTLEVEVENQAILDNVVGKLIFIVGLSTVLVGLIGYIFSYIVKKSITNHLSVISETTSNKERWQSKTLEPISLDRPAYRDELADLVDALNEGQRQVVEFAIARESYENQLEYQANYDVLTNLPNRRHIDQYLKQELEDATQTEFKNKLALFFIDLDGFKEVNDSLGHSVGDAILEESADRLRSLFGQYNGYIARFGGDEFISCCRCISRSEAELISEEIIAAFREHFLLVQTQTHLQLGCSIGVVVFPDDGADSEDLIRKADTAMYRAKENGRNTYAFFDQSMMHNILLNNTIKNKLKDAIEQNLLTLNFQPLICLADKSVAGFEALVRWKDPELGQVRPDLFIPIAEKTGLIFDLDIWVFQEAIKHVQAWRQSHDASFILSVNFSATNFHHKGLSNWIDQAPIFKEALDWVELEVTERLVLDDDPQVMRYIERFVSQGLRFSIDDFGTGYSSLAYIKKFSHFLSKIKIDRIFVNELLENESDQALIKSIVTLGESLMIEVLAEGIETPLQERALIDLNCGYAQGYYYSRPLPPEDIPEFLSNWESQNAENSDGNNQSVVPQSLGIRYDSFYPAQTAMRSVSWPYLYRASTLLSPAQLRPSADLNPFAP